MCWASCDNVIVERCPRRMASRAEGGAERRATAKLVSLPPFSPMLRLPRSPSKAPYCRKRRRRA